MNKLVVTFKQNIGAFATAAIAFILVVYYLAIVIPEHKAVADKYNLSKLEEFNKQLNESLKDYTNAIDTFELKKAIASNAESLLKTIPKNTTEPSVYNLISDLKDERGYIMRNWAKTLVIKSIKLDKIKDSGTEILLTTKIKISLDTLFINKEFKLHPDKELYKKLCTISLTKYINKRELQERLKSAVSFPYWLICKKDSAAAKNKNAYYTSLINNDVDNQEADSVRNSSSKLGVVSFKFTDKRFYKHYFRVEDTDFDVLLIGAVNANEFEAEAKKVKVSSIINSILLVLLLFLSVPLIKPLISGSKEKLTQFDLINTTVCIGVFIIVLVCFSLTNYLSLNQREHVDTKLLQINNNVEVAFKTELNAYRKRMVYIKELRGANDDIISRNISSAEGKNIRLTLQNYFEMNSEGDLVKDIYVNNNRSFRKNFKERDYFKALMKRDAGASVFSAVYSKNNNRFVTIFAGKTKRGSVKGFVYTPMFTKSIASILDIDYGYLICNGDGRVLLHSDSLKSLNENIYNISHKPLELMKLFHGFNNMSFDLDYNGKQHRFFAKRLKYNGQNADDAPVYLLSFKKLDFENNLQMYTIVNGFLISLAYTLGIVLLAALYSVFFYLGHMSLLSRFHIYWLFPDNSRKWEFNYLKIVNLILLVIFFILFIFGFKDLLYLSIIVGINVVFYNFVFLSQRVFVLHINTKKRNHFLSALFLTIFANLAISYFMYRCNQFSFGLSFSLLSHFIYLTFLKKQSKIKFDSTEVLQKEENKKNEFTDFLSSVISYHYFLIPIIIVFILFSNELNKAQLFNESLKNNTTTKSPDRNSEDSSNPNDDFFSTVSLISPPSDVLLKNSNIENIKLNEHQSGFIDFVQDFRHTWKLLSLIISIAIILLIIIALTKFYTGRFFFFDLSEAYRLGYFKTKNKFENLKIILPPFNEKDLENVEKFERFSEDENKALEHTVWINQISEEIVSMELKMELILMDNLSRYEDAYKKAWDELTDDEKFVMHDFSTDHFVNYKSKIYLLKLMDKGLIIADPLTGRLRVMNYGFKNFVIRNAHSDAGFIKQEEEEKSKGTFSKWKLPILIAAVTILLLVMYLYKQSFDQVLVIGGSVISAIGLIVKFLDSYKKT